MKTKNKRIKTAAICGALAVLSLVNVCVLSFNKSQVSPILTRNVNADAEILGPSTLMFGLGEFIERHTAYYKYKDRFTECSELEISNGTITRQELKESGINANVTGNATVEGTSQTTANASTTFNYKMDLKEYNSDYFTYKLKVSLPGKDWLVRTCMSSSKDEEGVLHSKCVPYDECAQTIQTRVNSIKDALKIK